MATGPFQWGAGGQALSPQEVERRRMMSAAAAQRGSDTSPVNHWSQGLARLVDAFGGYRGNMLAGEAETAGRTEAKGIIDALLGGGSNVSMSSMGAPAQPRGGIVADGGVGYTGQPASAPVGGNAERIRLGLIERGLPEHVADGFLMNFQDESGLNPGINEAAPMIPGSRGGFGLAQWTGPRRVGLEQAAAQRGVDPSDVDLQLDYLMGELQGSESAAAQSILGAQDAGSAASAIVNDFLRPAEEHRARRTANYTGGNVNMSSMGGGQGGTSPVMAALLQASANPWVQQEYGPVLQALMGQEGQRQQFAMQQAAQNNDPLRQLQIQQAQLELQQAQQPSALPYEIINGQVVQIDPMRGSTNVIGDYSQPEAGWTSLPAEQAAGMGLDPSQPYQVSPQGQIKPIGGDGVNVSVNTGEGDKFFETLDKAQGEMFNGLLSEGQVASTKLRQIDQLEQTLAQAPQGIEAAFKSALGEWGIKTDGLDLIQSANALINQIVPQQRQPGSGPMSDADLELFKQSVPRLINTPEGNQRIIQGMKALANYGQQQGAIAEAVANRDMTPAEGRRALAQLQNPLEGWNADIPSPPSPPAPPNGEMPPAASVEQPPAPPSPNEQPVRSQAEYDALPSGAVFIAPDGKRRRKP